MTMSETEVTKKLDITKFIPEDQRDGGEEYLTIRRLPGDAALRLRQYQAKLVPVIQGKDFVRWYDENGKAADYNALTEAEKISYVQSLNLTAEQAETLIHVNHEMSRVLVEYGVCPDGHTIRGTDGRALSLDYQLLNRIGSADLLEYIAAAVKEFSGITA